MLQAVIFDMDGVIVDSEEGFIDAKQIFLHEKGIEIDASYHHAFFGTTADYTWKKVKEDLNLTAPVDECISRVNEIRHELIEMRGLDPIPGAVELIRALYAEGIPLAVASSSPMSEIMKIVDLFEIRDCFQAFASGCDCVHSKPFPDVFLLAAKKLNVEPGNCVVIEDSANGVAAAKAANMACVGFRNPKYLPQKINQADQIVDRLDLLTLSSFEKLVSDFA